MIIRKSAEWHAERLNGIGGSDATRIMKGDIVSLWNEKTGRAEPEDLSRILPVVMGSFTEPLNIAWFEQETGRSVDVAKERLVKDFRHCELDGLTDYGTAIFEAKHVNAFTNMQEKVEQYIWQLHHNMHVAGVSKAVLSVFFGNMKWEYVEINEDPAITEQLLNAEADFWALVQSDTMPEDRASQTVDVSFDDMRDVDMTGSNEWASLADDWLSTKTYADTFTRSVKGLKTLVESDVKLASGHGIQAKRAKNGAITIKEI